jgi:FkbM family methyltransferase
MQNNALGMLQRQDKLSANPLFLDVGANRGQTAHEMRSTFQNATIHAFEPVPQTFEVLRSATADDPKIHAHSVALSAAKGTAIMTMAGTATSNKIVSTRTSRTADVETTTGDEWCVENNIAKIDLLKIDTEGADLKVLVGFATLLREHAVEWVQVECSTTPDNDLHVPLGDFMAFLHPFGYGFAGLFDQRTKMREVRRRGFWFANALFVREEERPA